MLSKLFQPTLLIPVIALYANLAAAGAGANIWGCIYQSTSMIPPVQYNFTVGGSGTNCMKSKGNDNTMTISASGVSCASLGYVENKNTDTGSDNCVSYPSNWLLSYTSNSTVSGTTNSGWHAGITGNEMHLESQTLNTYSCPSPALCSLTSTSWKSGHVANIYIIFEPQIIGAPPKCAIDIDGKEYKKFYAKAHALIDAIEDNDDKKHGKHKKHSDHHEDL